jgi:Bax protein
MLKYNILIPFVISCSLYGSGEVKMLPSNFLDTQIGTIQNQKLITTLPKKIKKVEPKKVVIHKEKKRPKKPTVTVTKKKANFVNTLAPIIQKVYKNLENRYLEVLTYVQNKTHEQELAALRKEYKAEDNIELLKALKPHPVSIVLAQGAMESAWLTSRFAKDANNIFGVWSFNKNEPRIAAGGSRENRIIYLKKYNSFEHAVEDYYKTVARSWAYEALRENRIYTDDPYKLLPYFDKYSEKGIEYTKILAKIIKKNNFDKYDIRD